MGKGGRARAQAGPSPPHRRRRPLALQVLEPERAPLLFNLVFGEGVINDATTIALLRTVQALGPEPRMSVSTVVGMLASFASLFAFSLALGVAVGLGASLLLKRTGVHGVPQARAGCGHGRWVAGQARPPHRARPRGPPPPPPPDAASARFPRYHNVVCAPTAHTHLDDHPPPLAARKVVGGVAAARRAPCQAAHKAARSTRLQQVHRVASPRRQACSWHATTAPGGCACPPACRGGARGALLSLAAVCMR